MNSLPLIERLIAFDTTSAKSNLELIGFVQSYLEELGVDSALVSSEDGLKANLYATIGPKDRGGVMLSGHSDVVPVTGQEWSSDPFQALVKDSKIYGRGSADMKSFIAVVLATLPEMLAEDLSIPIHLAISYDEEVGCVGVRRLLEMMAGLPIKPAMCIIGEPTGMDVMVGHKGKIAARAHVQGLECHSSLAPQGVNAIDYAAELIVFIRRLADSLAQRGPRDEAYEVPTTTIHTGTVQGGTALNIVPKDCRFDFEIRSLPEDDPEALLAKIETFAHQELEPRMKDVAPTSGIHFERLSGYPGLNTDPGEEVVTFVKALASVNDHGKIAFGTEGGLFQKTVGIPTVVCGPGHIAQAHKPDEWISLEQVAACERFMERLIARVRA